MIARLKERLKEMANPSKRTARIVLAGICLLALAWQQVQATRLGYRVEASRKQLRLLEGRLGSLQMQLQSSISPSQLAAQARGRLGMQPASPESLRILGRPDARRENESFLSRLLSRTWRWTPASA